PQGKFSSTSLGVLKSQNYLAAVNSSVKPQDLADAHGLTLADLLVPAIFKYNTFPLYMRRYPRNLVDFAFDLFLGKPALMVEHHGYLKDGSDSVRDFTAGLNSLSPKLQWLGLGELVRKTHLQRNIAPDIIEYRIFANRQVIENLAPRAKKFIVLKPEDNKIPIEAATVNGKPQPYIIEGGQMRLPLEVPAFA